MSNVLVQCALLLEDVLNQPIIPLGEHVPSHTLSSYTVHNFNEPHTAIVHVSLGGSLVAEALVQSVVIHQTFLDNH